MIFYLFLAQTNWKVILAVIQGGGDEQHSEVLLQEQRCAV
jgi:hypothetical protein